MPTVTALRRASRGRVAVELDGAPWRTLPDDVVGEARLRVGTTLDRPALRSLRRKLRQAEALAVATRSLAAHDQSAQTLTEKLARRGVPPAARTEAVHALERTGLLDDGRTACSRARSLAERGYGDAAITADLERRGIASELVLEALAELEPEGARAVEIARRRGPGARTARFLAGKGFSADVVEAVSGVGFANDP